MDIQLGENLFFFLVHPAKMSYPRTNTWCCIFGYNWQILSSLVSKIESVTVGLSPLCFGFYVDRPYVNYGDIFWLNEDEKVNCQPDISVLSSVQADSSCSACLTTGRSERAFSAWTRAATSLQWIAAQLHLVYARVCAVVCGYEAGVHMSGVFVPPSLSSMWITRN